MGLLNCKEGFNIEGEAREEINIDEQLNCKYNFEDLCDNNNIEKKNERGEKIENIINNFHSNDNILESIRHELETELEKTNFDKCCEFGTTLSHTVQYCTVCLADSNFFLKQNGLCFVILEGIVLRNGQILKTQFINLKWCDPTLLQ